MSDLPPSVHDPECLLLSPETVARMLDLRDKDGSPSRSKVYGMHRDFELAGVRIQKLGKRRIAYDKAGILRFAGVKQEPRRKL